MSTVVIESLQQANVPYTYTLSGAQTFTPETAFATFDGSGASGDFLACMSFLAQDGKRFMRVFPTTPVAGGDVADVTFAPFPGGIGNTQPVSHDIPFCIVGFQVTVPASTAYTLMPGDLSFIVGNVYPDFYALDGATGGLLIGTTGLNRYDTLWTVTKTDFTLPADPSLLKLGLVADNHLIPSSVPVSEGFPTGANGTGFTTWLPTDTAGDADVFRIDNQDPVNELVVTCSCNVWYLNSDAPE